MAERPPGPLPAPPLTIRPSGLLDFLSIQAGGRYPQHLTEDLVPTMDLLNWFLEAQAETVTSGSIAQTGAGSSNVGFTVPAGEAWLVGNYSIHAPSMTAGVTKWQNALCVFDTDGTTVRHILATCPFPVLAAEQVSWAFVPPTPQLWLPGTPIGLTCLVSTGGVGASCTLRLRMVRCTV